MHDDCKTERVLKMIRIIQAHPAGIRRSDLSRLLALDPSTVSRYIRDISRDLQVYEDDERLVHIDPEGLTMQMELTIYELAFVHLASRLFLKSFDKYNPHAGTCLSKLARLFNRFSPDTGRFLDSTAAELEKRRSSNDCAYREILKSIVTAWVLGRKTRIVHHSHRRNEDDTYLFHPYWIEPGSGKTSVYAIGFSEEENQYRILKVDRIGKVEVLDDLFTVREDFEIGKYLHNAWGIWTSENPPVEIVLRFSPNVRGRVLENKWHDTEKTEATDDGGILWKASVSQPLEMIPWIRGWGADVEVLEPADLRQAIREELDRMKKMYEG
jgi:CRISPR-associated endonuclease/helicase Cas3